MSLRELDNAVIARISGERDIARAEVATLTREHDEAKAGAAVATERWVKAEQAVTHLQGALEAATGALTEASRECNCRRDIARRPWKEHDHDCPRNICEFALELIAKLVDPSRPKDSPGDTGVRPGLRPAREVAHEKFGSTCGEDGGEVRHSVYCTTSALLLEADRRSR